MPFIPFSIKFPEEAKHENFIISLEKPPSGGLPAGQYQIHESFCTDFSCDCRKVMLNVYSPTGGLLGTVGFGWESPEYYADWLKQGNLNMGKQMASLYLEEGVEQGQYSRVALQLAEQFLQHQGGRDLVREHYELWQKDKTEMRTEKIISYEHALAVLYRQREGVPFFAIEYLRDRKTTDDLLRHIRFAISHINDEDVSYDAVDEYYYMAPLWFMVVAEKHLDESLIEPVINIYSEEDSNNDFIYEQGGVLLSMLAKEYPKKVIRLVTEFVDAQTAKDSKSPYLYVFDVFNYVEVKWVKEWMLKKLEDPNLYWKDSFAHHVADLQIQEARPILEKLKKEHAGGHEEVEYAEAIEILDGTLPVEKDHLSWRGDWKTHFARNESRFYDDADEDDEEEDETDDPDQVFSNIGRNNLCPCGSGMKFKKCHGK